MTQKFPFEPDYLVPPGETLKETLNERGLTQIDLSLRTGMSEKTISQIINGIAPITYETAEKLELVTGVPAGFWNRREMRYRELLARHESVEQLKPDVEWLSEIPVKELVSRGYIKDSPNKVELVRGALRFFGVSDVAAWRNTWAEPVVQFRGGQAQEKRPGYVAAWLRMGQLQAENLAREPFDARQFRYALNEIRDLTVRTVKEWRPLLESHCGKAGVVVVFTKEIPLAGVSGATRWLDKDSALLQLSLRYKTDDQLWFTFFHEAAHILLHGKRQIFLEDGKSDTKEELEADRFARELLIPQVFASRLPYLKSKQAIVNFAAEIGIAPGIVVGRLQKDKVLKPAYCNDLKRKFAWGDR